MIDKLVFASKNKGKIREVKHLFQNINIDIIPVAGLFNPIENGRTFFDNALIKAREAAKITSMASLADDSGLIVDALNGEPGVRSSRYADSDQNKITKLLNALKDVSENNRTARFVCSMVLTDSGGKVLHSTEGVCEGKIIYEPHGNDGFGFDPVFFIPELNRTLAELTVEKKNTLSHRAKALTQMLDWIRKYNR